MRWLRALILVALAAVSAAAAAQTVTTSPGPDRVAVTVYRDPNRSPATAPNLGWLNGYALISETRQVNLPAGESEIRFEGVAGGILPQSAIVTGLPQGVIERNRDAYLLSPATLLDRSLGRRVHLRRTSNATGVVREEDAVIRSGANGAVVLQTGAGFEALRCTGLAETVTYDQVPAGLSVRPTLSVRARSDRPVAATVTLSYIASGFDWQANYIAHLSPDGEHVDLFAWLTLANGDETGFANAETQAVAGRLNRGDARAEPSEGPPLYLQCWPSATTSDVPSSEDQLNSLPQAYPPPPPPPPPAPMAMREAIVVTGSRIMAQQEALGDVKLYRIPEPVTVAAHSQKQVAMIDRPSVRVGFVYRQDVDPTDTFDDQPARRLLVTRNRTAEGLGLPLPAGRLVLFAQGAGRPILIGEGYVADRAVGEDVEVRLDDAPGVRSRLRRLATGKGVAGDYELVVTNDSARPLRYEALIGSEGVRLDAATRLGRRNGRTLWAPEVPANGTATLRYRIAPAR